MKKIIFLIFVLCSFGIVQTHAQRRMEKLGRGVVAVRTGTSSAFISWRLLGTDPRYIGFNIYRSAGGAAAVKLNSDVLTKGTNFTDNSINVAVDNSYFVKPVVNGVEQAASDSFTLSANHAVEPCYTVPLKPGSSIHFVWVGDLDGDGEYDFIVDRIDGTNNSEKIEAYKHDGTYLWTVDFGSGLNLDGIKPGPTVIDVGNWDGVTVYDMDGDGKAEVMIKSASGVTFGDGEKLTYSDPNVQFISVLDGMTGAEKARIQIPNNYLSVGPMGCSLGIGYLNGLTPSLVGFFKNRNSDGSFNRLMCAWDYDGTNIKLKWKTNLPFGASYSAHGADGHQMRILDVNGDGKDEVGEIAFMLNGEDGSLLYDLGNQGIGHGDRWHVGKLDPNRPGLQGYGIQQDNSSGIIDYYYDAGTGKIIWKHTTLNVGDAARGEAGDIDPRYPGYETWSFSGLYNAPLNKKIADTTPYPNFRIWWDGDVLSENLDNLRIEKWNYKTSGVDRLVTAYHYETATQSARNAPLFYGDIMGDWREEVVYTSSDYSKLVIFTTPDPTDVRLYTLAQDPEYRNCMTIKGYLQSNMLDYYLGAGMTTPPTPPIQTAKCIWKGSATDNSWDVASTANWTVNDSVGTFTQGDDVMFDIAGEPDTAVVVKGTLDPSSIKVITALNYSFNGTGKISGTTGLLKAGNGALSFNCPADYTDTTRVEEGSVFVNDTLSQSPVTVSFAATIGGSGKISQPVMLAPGAMVSPGAKGTTGTLTFAKDLNLPSHCSLLYDLTNDSTSAIKPSDKIVINGNLILPDTMKIIINKIDGKVLPGSYPLIVYSGSLTGSVSHIAVSGLFGQKYALVNSNGVISLTIEASRDPGNLTWNGSSNVWDLQTTPAWSMNDNPVTFVANDTVTFDANGSNNPTINVVGTLPVGNMFFDTSDNNYHLSGNGNIGGTGSLVKTGAGVLSLLTKNSFTGTTKVNNGTLEVNSLADAGVNSSIGANASTSPSALTLNDATLNYSSTGSASTNKGMTLGGSGDTLQVKWVSATLTVQGTITGSGNLVKTGAGILNLQKSVNTFKGNTIVKFGTLSLGDETANTNGIGSGSLTLDDGTLIMYSNTGTYTNFNTNIIVPEFGTGTLNTDARCNYKGTLTGDGIFNVYLTGTIDRTIFFGNWSAFTGLINVNGVSGAKFRIANSYGYPNAVINLGNNISMYHGGTGTTGGDAVATTVKIGALSGRATSTLLDEKWVIGNRNTDSRYDGVIAGYSVTKVGTGILYLSNSNTYTGGTTVSNGVLKVVNASGSATGTGPVSVLDSGTLSGTGYIAGNTTIGSGGILAPGNGSVGVLTFNSGVTLGTGSKLAITVTGTSCGKLAVQGNLTLGGTLEMKNAGSYQVGDSYRIFTAGSVSGQLDSISPATPGDNLQWDMSRINEGIISVNQAQGINNVSELSNAIYPNPVKHVLNFKKVIPDGTDVVIYNVYGKLVKHEKLNKNQINVDGMVPGYYFVKVQGGNLLKFLKQ